VLTVEGRVVAVMDGHPPDVAGHVLAADTAMAGARLLAIADVICSASDAPERWLARFPGSAVAVTAAGDHLLAATRAGQLWITHNDGAPDPLVIALFLNAWLSASQSPDLPDPVKLTTTAWLTRTCRPRAFALVTESR
jgi:hypothetical protein